jgi:hypothetical protein
VELFSLANASSSLEINPITGEVGFWLVTSELGLVGLAKSAWPAQPGGPAATRLARWQTSINTALADVGTVSIPLSGIPPGDPRLTTPEPSCRIVGSNYVCNRFTILVTILSLSPVLYEWRVVNGTDDVVRL